MKISDLIPTDPEAPLDLNLSEALRLPGFDPRLRDLIVALLESPAPLTVGEIASMVGEPVQVFARKLILQTALAEVMRLVSEDAPKGGLN